MRTLTARVFVAAFFLATAAVGFGNPFKSKIITGNDSALIITVPDDHFLKITNFMQDGGTDRGAVHVTLQDTENGGTAKVLSATRVDLSTGTNSQNFPEISNRVVISGPATVRVPPVVGATLFITYKKARDEGSQGGGGTTPTPIPGVSPTAIPVFTPTATPTPNPFISPTPTAFGG